MNDYDFLIVGAGFSGAVLAERLNSIDKKVLVIEKRNHLGGNSYDYYDEHRVLVHKYGPHYFRTNDEGVFNYLSKFTKWRAYEYRIRTCVNGILYPIPINRDTLNKFFEVNLKSDQEAKDFLNSKQLYDPLKSCKLVTLLDELSGITKKDIIPVSEEQKKILAGIVSQKKLRFSPIYSS